MSESNKGYFKLGRKATIFWDPSQSKNTKVVAGQVVELDLTDKVEINRINRGLVEVEKKEFDAYLKQQEDNKKDAVKDAKTSKVETELATVALDRIKLADAQLKDLERREAELQKREDAHATRDAELQQKSDDLNKQANEMLPAKSVTPGVDDKANKSK